MGASSAEVRILSNESLGSGSFVLTLERPVFTFQAGQYLSLSLKEHREQREYSIYSGEQDPFLQVLVKEVPEGLVSPRLARLKAGDRVQVEGPFGYFTLDQAFKTGGPLLLVATGTGISPFHSFIRTYPQLGYRLLHGVRQSAETSLERDFAPGALTACVSRGPGGQVQGRVTSALKTAEVSPGTHAFLCGNCDMIYEVFDLLRERGVPAEHIYTEVYF